MSPRSALLRCTLIAALVSPLLVQAHHSRNFYFDQSKLVEVEGTITKVLWRHPHARLWIEADAAFGGGTWELETTPPSILEREGINKELLQVGNHVKVAGAPARQQANAMEVSHILLPDSREVLLYGGLEPIWSDAVLARELQPFSDEAVANAIAGANGIFRVWSREGGIRNRPHFWLDNYPLTPAASIAASAWQEADHVFTGCVAKDMPSIMDNIWPFEFVDEGDTIRLRIEEFDKERQIHMNQQMPATMEPSALGYSVGRWEDGVLVVETAFLTANELGTDGIQLRNRATLEERFTLAADAGRLDYALTVTDPAVFTAPVTQSSWWTWRPGEVVKPYECVEDPDSWTSQEAAE
jgi:hypothetical protein